MANNKKYDIIFDDFIQGRHVKIFKVYKKVSGLTHALIIYTMKLQVFAPDNLPFSVVTGKKAGSHFNFNCADDTGIFINQISGQELNPATQKYEATDHTFIKAIARDSSIGENAVITQMKHAAQQIISELEKHDTNCQSSSHPLTDVQRVQMLLTDRNVKISDLSKAVHIPAFTLYNYRKNPASITKASHSYIEALVNKYFDTYCNRNEVERFRFSLLKILTPYLKQNQDNPINYNPAYELYRMTQTGEWHRLAKMEELWKKQYNAAKKF